MMIWSKGKQFAVVAYFAILYSGKQFCLILYQGTIHPFLRTNRSLLHTLSTEVRCLLREKEACCITLSVERNLPDGLWTDCVIVQT